VKVNNIYTGSTTITVCAILVPIVSALGFIPNSTALIIVSTLILLFGIGAGMMLVPLNALIQAHSAKDGLGNVLAGKNWIQNMAMIGLLLLTVLLAKSNVSSVYILYLNALIAVVGFTVVLKRLKAIL
jgi:acyl-[acyl-carrier-protein]-phospholipid O-acyltransferase/long-chain-fatty-acid--[acyl-carrier-protein] ligase